MTMLYGVGHPDVSITDALAAAGLIGGTALLATPSRYHVALVTADGCITPHGPIDDLRDVFEARVFTPDAELRWLHEADQKGRAVFLTEDENLLPADFDPVPALAAIETLPTQYLLWGEPASASGQWTTLSAGRIGPRDVPIRATGGRVRLAAREYVAVDEHGNAYIAEERLIGLEPYQPRSKEGNAA